MTKQTPERVQPSSAVDGDIRSAGQQSPAATAAPTEAQAPAAPIPPRTRAPQIDEPTMDSSEDQASQDAVAIRLRAGFQRVPFGAMQQKLAYPPRPGFHRHWFNDYPGRIEQAKAAGYEHVTQNGEPVGRPVGTREGGGALVAYLMEIPQEWFQEDQALHQARVDEVDRAIGAGTVEAERREQGYIPETGIKIRASTR